MITIIDYGLGNIQAFVTAYKALGVPTRVASEAEELAAAERLVLPGVGAFDWAMARLDASGMRDSLDELVLDKGVPVLGVCVGMQMMARRSAEGRLPGLGWLDADVERLATPGLKKDVALPHMGWNRAKPLGRPGVLKGLEPDASFYFLHSYYVQPQHEQDVIAETEYGVQFASAVACNNIWGVQFHPEKSHDWGVRLLKNFAEVA